MKFTLITEEQIKAIQDALDVSTTYFNKDRQTVLNALAIVKSLKVQEPVGYASILTDYLSQDKHLVGAIDDQTLTVGTKLYAGEQA